MLALVICAVLVSAALPLRELLSQRGQIAAAQHLEAAQRQRVATLQRQQQQLNDPAFVTTLARERLHFVKPGEMAYMVIGEPKTTGHRTAPTPGAAAPWYSQLYGSLRAADHPVRP